MNLTLLFYIFYGINCFSASITTNLSANTSIIKSVNTGIAANDIRVRIEKNLKQLDIQGQTLSVQGDNVLQKISIPSSRKLNISRLNISGKYFWQIKDKSNNKSIVYYEKFLSLKGESLYGAKGPVPNKLILSATKNRIDVIGVLPIEDYLVWSVGKRNALKLAHGIFACSVYCS